jgi:hypothetical protein
MYLEGGSAGNSTAWIYSSELYFMSAASATRMIMDSTSATFYTDLDTTGVLSGSSGLNITAGGASIAGNVSAPSFIKTGTTSSGTMVAATDKSVAVTFGTAFPDANYVVTLGLNEPSSGGAAHPRATVTSKTASGFTLVFRRETGTAAISMAWAAIRT